MDFPSAMSLVLSGSPVMRRSTGNYVFLITADRTPMGYWASDKRLIVSVNNQTNAIAQFIPTQEDMIGSDWEVSEWTRN